jgi:hypothetical protein
MCNANLLGKAEMYLERQVGGRSVPRNSTATERHIQNEK